VSLKRTDTIAQTLAARSERDSVASKKAQKEVGEEVVLAEGEKIRIKIPRGQGSVMGS
jgi:hypothetical protein